MFARCDVFRSFLCVFVSVFRVLVAGGNLIPILGLLSFNEYKTFTLKRYLRKCCAYNKLRLFTKTGLLIQLILLQTQITFKLKEGDFERINAGFTYNIRRKRIPFIDVTIKKGVYL